MKLLGWMQRKLRGEVAPRDLHKDFADGCHPSTCLFQQPAPEELHPHYQHHLRPLMRLSTARQADLEEHQPHVREELLLQGLLTIGTLGLGPRIEGLPPPQLLHLFDSIVAGEEQPEATEKNMMATDSELPTALAAENHDKNSRLSSASTGYACLFLGDQLAKNQSEKAAAGTGGSGAKKDEKRKIAPMAGMMKKMLKRRGSKAGSAPSGEAVAAPAVGALLEGTSTAESKLCQILKIFHKKVHPEGSVAQKQHVRSPRSNMQVRNPYSGDSGGGGEVMAFSSREAKKGAAPCCFGCRSYLSTPPGQASGDSNSSREHWIKTDMDCK